MKKLFVLALIVILALLIFGCGQKSDQQGEQDQPPAEETVETAAPDTVETIAPDSTVIEADTTGGN